MTDSFTPITLSVPATSANLGPGFDSMGLAVALYNHFTVCPAPVNRLLFSVNGVQDMSDVSTNPADSLFFKAMAAYAEQHPEQQLPNAEVTIEAHIPLSRGLGSSSTVVVAGLLSASRLLGHDVHPKDLLELATQLEGHPDNVAPALLGGVQLCHYTSGGTVQAQQLPWPDHWRIIFVVPPDPLSTHAARQVMPKHYPIGDAVANLQAAALLVHALHTADVQAMADALTDTLHQPYRIPLIPAFKPVAEVARQAGAMGTVISGAGSALAVIVNSTKHSQVANALDQWIDSQNEKAYTRLDLTVLV